MDKSGKGSNSKNRHKFIFHNGIIFFTQLLLIKDNDMALRYIDSNLFNDDWFMDLSKDAKILWLYFITQANHAGILKMNLRLCQYQTGITDIDGIIKELGGRIITIEEQIFFIPKFLSYQYPGFPNSKVRAQDSAIKILKNYSLWNDEENKINIENTIKGLTKGYVTLNKGLGNHYDNDNDNDNDNNNKEKEPAKNKNENLSESYQANENINKLYNWIMNGILKGTKQKVFPEKVLPKTKSESNAWIKCIADLIKDGYSIQEINRAIIFGREDIFWKSNFLSLLKLRRKDKEGVKYIDRFLLAYEKGNGSISKPGAGTVEDIMKQIQQARGTDQTVTDPEPKPGETETEENHN